MSEAVKEAPVAPAGEVESVPTPSLPLVYANAMTSQEERFMYALQLLQQAPRIRQGDREYTTVAVRLSIFRRAFGPCAGVITEVEHVDNDVVRVRADIHIPVGHAERIYVASGRAEEWRGDSAINMTSALENAETSAIGRALAALGLHGGEFASANEVEGAKAAQTEGRERDATSILDPEEIADAIARINDSSSDDELAVIYLKLNPALKIACRASFEAKKRLLKNSSAHEPGSETAAAASPEAPSRPRSGSGPRRGRSSGGA